MNVEMMKINEVSEITGFKAGTIYNMVTRRKIPYFKLNGALRFDRAAIEAWIADWRQRTERRPEK